VGDARGARLGPRGRGDAGEGRGGCRVAWTEENRWRRGTRRGGGGREEEESRRAGAEGSGRWEGADGERRWGRLEGEGEVWICGVGEFVGELFVFVVVVVVDITITIVDIAINPFLFPKKENM
jgi:hypothetical protein